MNDQNISDEYQTTCERCKKMMSVLESECFYCGPNAMAQKLTFIKAQVIPFLYGKFQSKSPPYKRSVTDHDRDFHVWSYKREFFGEAKVKAFEIGFATGYKDGFEDAATYILSSIRHLLDKSDLDDLEGFAKGLQWRFSDQHPYRKIL